MATKDSKITTIDDDAPGSGAAAASQAAPVAVTSGLYPQSQPEWQERVWVTIHTGDGELGKKDVFLSVNGIAVSVKRGERVALPKPYVSRLSEMMMQTYDQSGDNPAAVPRFSYTVHGPVSEADMAQFQRAA